MPYVFKPKYTIPIPANAERIEIKGRACVRWKSRGRTVVGEVCERNPARCRVESGKWWLVAVDQHGQEHKRPGFRDRKASERAASDLQTRLDRVAAGVLPASALADAAPLTELIEQWGRHLVNSGSGERRISRSCCSMPRSGPPEVGRWSVRRAVAPGRGKNFGENLASPKAAQPNGIFCKALRRWENTP